MDLSVKVAVMVGVDTGVSESSCTDIAARVNFVVGVDDASVAAVGPAMLSTFLVHPL